MGSAQDCVQVLETNDVLLGRGSIIADKPGNIQFRKIIETRKEEYQRSPLHVKSQIAKSIMTYLQCLDPPARFVEERNAAYIVVLPRKALEKTMQALREKPPTKRAAEAKTNNISSIQIPNIPDNVSSIQRPSILDAISSIQRPSNPYNIRTSYFPQELTESYYHANAANLTYNKVQSCVYASPTFGKTSGIAAKTDKVDTPHKRASTRSSLLMPQYDIFCDADESPLDASCAIYFECLLRRKLR